MKEIKLTTEEIQYYEKHGYDVKGNMPIFLEDAFKRKDCLNEIRMGEKWVGNMDARKTEEYLSRRKSIPSLRIGEQAYDIEGKPIARFVARPLFINKRDQQAYDDFMMGRV